MWDPSRLVQMAMNLQRNTHFPRKRGNVREFFVCEDKLDAIKKSVTIFFWERFVIFFIWSWNRPMRMCSDFRLAIIINVDTF